MEMLVTMMKKHYDPMFNQDDFEYRLYLQDHRSTILENSQTVAIPPNVMAMYEYRPKEYLRSKGLPVAADWLVLWINSIQDREHFKNLKELIIPSMSTIETLYDTYRSLRSKQGEIKKQIVV